VFLPQETCAASLPGHPLLNLLFKTPMWVTFEFRCPRGQRHLRYARNAGAPVDARELEMERLAEEADAVPAARARAEERRRRAAQAAAAGGGAAQAAAGGAAGDATEEQDADASNMGAVNPRAAAQQARRRAERAAEAAAPPRPREPIRLLNDQGRPKFYHSRTCVALTQEELDAGADSDDEHDGEEWEVRERRGRDAAC
jgi:hypothetical protein